MAYTKKTWGTYQWDEDKTFEENIAAAKTAKALIETTDMQRIEDGIDSASKPAWADITGKPPIPPAYTLPAATASALGGVKKAATQADSTATDAEGLVSDFNALLAKLKAAGIMA